MRTISNRPSQSKRMRHLVIIVSALIIVSVLATQTGLVGLAEGLLPRASAPDKQPPEPLTDVAPPQPEVDVTAEESPQVRLAALGLDKLPPADLGLLPWDVIDVRNPPQWTETLAQSAAEIVPPDPFTPPSMIVNPERGQADDSMPSWAIQPPMADQRPPTTDQPQEVTK